MGSEVHYHYTSVETLFKIVEGRKLRLSNISFMDDKTEFEWLWRLVEEEIIKRRTSENSTEIDRKNLGDLQIKIDRWRGPNAETGRGRFLICFVVHSPSWKTTTANGQNTLPVAAALPSGSICRKSRWLRKTAISICVVGSVMTYRSNAGALIRY